eukprot:Platyproteum_vivax@DN904_c0_g1_i1.p1
MESVQILVKKRFQQAISTAFPAIQHEAIVSVADPKFGDYQCNSAMKLFKDHGKEQGLANPRAVAAKIESALSKDDDMIASAATAGPGFITVKLRDEWLTLQLKSTLALTPLRIGQPPVLQKQASSRVVVDFSSPNIAKEMHVGHLRSTILGEAICRILEFCGLEVVRLNHVGDWGTQFGMLIELLCENFGDCLTDEPKIADLQAFYKQAKARFDADSDFKERARARVVKLQAGDETCLRYWKVLCDISRKAFQDVYNRLEVSLVERGESFYNSRIKGIVDVLTQQGVVQESEGAKCIFTSAADIPLIVQKSDGGYGYDSTDMAAIHHRLKEMSADWIIYVTDLGQEKHFLMIFEAAKMSGWLEAQTRLDHVGFGLVKGAEGKKFKTRSGEVVRLVDLLDEAKERALAELQSRKGEAADEHLHEDDWNKAAECLGYAAVKYFDLKQNRKGDYTFSYDAMLDTKGNTAVYMMYAYARLCGIVRKAEAKEVFIKDIGIEEVSLSLNLERELALKLLYFPDMVNLMCADLHIHRLAEYMYDVSEKFNNFYSNCKVIGSPEERSRLLLCEITRRMLETCFRLLGITPLNRI